MKTYPIPEQIFNELRSVLNNRRYIATDEDGDNDDEVINVLSKIESIAPTAIDWKLKLMQILDAVGQAEGVWFEPWAGVSAEEQAEIEKEYAAYEAEKTHSD